MVATGAGIISSLGCDLNTVTDHLRQGISGISSVEEWRELGLRTWVAGQLEVGSRIERSRLPVRTLQTMGEVSAHCVLAAEDAIDAAALDQESLARADFGCIVGSGVGSMPGIYEGALQLYSGKARRIRPHSILQSMSSAASAHLVNTFGIGGRSYSISAACSTSAHALGHGFELIRAGVLTGALVGGGDEVNALVAAAFNALRMALSTRFNEQPERASRPFDVDRDGFVLSGGAGVVVLEELNAARARKAPILGEILGYASNSDGFDLVLPEPEGRTAASCMTAALKDAGLEPADVSYVNAHATGTPTGDIAEVLAIRQVFGDRAPPIASVKALAGHALGAAGVHEAIYSWLMMRGGFLTGSHNVEQIDSEINGCTVLRENRATASDIHISNSFGFGGTNASLVLRGGDHGAHKP